jgi:hypothetical protein
VQVDAQISLTHRDEARNVEDGVRRELMQLHARNLWVGRERPRRRKERKITRKPSIGRGMTSSPGKATSMDSKRKLDFLALVRSALVMADVDQPTTVPLLAECFIIGRRSTMSFTRMQWKSSKQKACGDGKQ